MPQPAQLISSSREYPPLDFLYLSFLKGILEVGIWVDNGLLNMDEAMPHSIHVQLKAYSHAAEIFLSRGTRTAKFEYSSSRSSEPRVGIGPTTFPLPASPMTEPGARIELATPFLPRRCSATEPPRRCRAGQGNVLPLL